MFISADMHADTKQSRRRLFRYRSSNALPSVAQRPRTVVGRKHCPSAARRYAQRPYPTLTPLDIIDNQRGGFPLQRSPRPLFHSTAPSSLKLLTSKRGPVKQRRNRYNSKRERLQRSIDQPNPDLRWLKNLPLKQLLQAGNKSDQPVPALTRQSTSQRDENSKLPAMPQQAELHRRAAASYAAKPSPFSSAVTAPTTRSTQPSSFWQQPYYRFLGPLQLMLMASAFTFLPGGIRWLLFFIALPYLAVGLAKTVREDQAAKEGTKPLPALAPFLRFFDTDRRDSLAPRLRNIAGISGVILILLIATLFGLDETASFMLSPLILIALLVLIYFIFIRRKR